MESVADHVHNMKAADGDELESGSASRDIIGKTIPLQQRDELLFVDTQKSIENNTSNKRIDFILAYVDSGNLSHAHRREEYEADLRDQGLELEYEHNGHLSFIKVHAPQEVLCRFCEIMKLKLPIKQVSNNEIDLNDSNDLFDDARSWFINLFRFVQLDPVKFPKQKTQLLAEFSRDKEYLFDVENENFFPTNVRLMIVDFILVRQSVSIDRLVDNGVFSAAYPLHDGTYKQEGSIRALLYQEWGAMCKLLNLQPLDTIREYFGVRLAIYFAWLGYYTYMLVPASIFGLLCFFYGWATLSTNRLAEEACSPWAENVIMCPLCNRNCDYWRLSETCTLTKATVLFDNPATVVFGVFMAFWSVLYLELWRRRSEELIYRWGLVGWDHSAEHPRPQYLALLSKHKILKAKKKINSVTMEEELRVSFWRVRVPATLLSFSVVLLLLLAAIAAVFAVVFYRMSRITTNQIFGHEFDSFRYKTFALPSIAAAMNLVCILILNYLYDWLAVRLTEMEMLRTQTEFDDSLTLKIYIFQFVNYYASIFYVAFLKGKFVGYPKKYNLIFGQRQEECAPGGCLMELCIQLVIIMVGKQALATAIEMIFPILLKWWTFFRIHTGLKREDPIPPRMQWLRDFKLLDWGPRGLYDEYLEMVIQFGFITLFVVAFPLAPLFALVNNVLEMRLDATKFLRHYRRPVPRRARDIGVWKQILDTLARISITTNAFIIAFSSNILPRFVYMRTESRDGTDRGFLNHSLAYFNTSHFLPYQAPRNSIFENITMCRYPEYRNPPDHPESPYKRPAIYWHILAVRFIFIVIFQSVISIFTMAVQWGLTGVPRKLRDRIKREAYLTERIIINREAERSRVRNRFASTTNNLRRRSNKSSEMTTL